MTLKHLALGLALTISAGAANAAVLFDNINVNPGDLDWGGTGIGNAATNTGATFAGGPIAASFYAPTSDTISRVTVRLSWDPATVELPKDGVVSVYLVPDDGTGVGVGVAGDPTSVGTGATFSFTGATLLGTISESELTVDPTDFTVWTSTGVAAGVYWVGLVADNSSAAAWWYNFPNPTGAIGSAGQYGFDQSIDASPTMFPFAAGSYEMIVEAPEPTSLALLGVSLAGVGIISRRRKRVAG